MAVQVDPPVQTRKVTYAEYAAMPDDGHRYQVIEGELIMSPAPNKAHQHFLRNLFRILDSYARTNKIGEVYFAPFDVVLSGENVVQPDTFFVSKERLKIITDANVQGAPDLVVEVLAPGPAR